METIAAQQAPTVQAPPPQAVPQQVVALTREDLVLRIFFTDLSLSGKMRAHMSPELFQDANNRNIVLIVNKFERKYNRTPTAQELIVGMGANDYAIQARDKLLFICNAQMQYIHQDYAVALVESFFKERMAEMVLVNAAESIHDKQVDGIRDLLPKLRDAVNFSLQTDLGLNMYTDADQALASLREQKQCIPSRIYDIRFYTGKRDLNGNLLYGGYYRKSLNLFVGQPNIGKSLIMCSEAAYAYMQGFNVLYITLELAEDYVWQRLCANICNVDLYMVLGLTGDQVRQAIFTKTEEMREAGARPGELHVKYMKTTTTPVEIESVIDSFEIAHGKLDLLVVDYIGIMKPAKGAKTESSMYADGVAKAEQIRDLAVMRNFAALSAVQFNRSGYHSLEAGIESVEGSSGYAETSDLMISITGDDVLRSFGMYSHIIMKSRFGQANITFVTKAIYKTMTWQDVSKEELADYTAARADADVQVNSGGQKGGKDKVKRAGGTPSANQGGAQQAEEKDDSGIDTTTASDFV